MSTSSVSPHNAAEIKVSIVLPTYNGSRYIRESIESCLAQTHANLELIIVDDCSTDETPGIVLSYSDPRIRYIRHAMNKGLPEALNTGFRLSQGSHLTWTSDDNAYEPDALKLMLHYLVQNPEIGLVYTDYWMLDQCTGKKKPVLVPQTLNLSLGNDLGCCFMYRRDVYDQVGEYDADTRLAEDYDYWIRVTKLFAAARLPVIIYTYRWHSEQLYQSRFYEVKIVDILVRTRHGLCTADQTSDFLSELAVKRVQETARYLRIPKTGRLQRWILRRWFVATRTTRIRSTLRALCRQEIGLAEARRILVQVFGL